MWRRIGDDSPLGFRSMVSLNPQMIDQAGEIARRRDERRLARLSAAVIQEHHDEEPRALDVRNKVAVKSGVF
jgi:hypothetical protein